jgi:hypothetical protein
VTKAFSNFIPVLAALLIALSPAGAADSGSDAASSQFQLSAQMNEHPQLSRSEVNGDALVKLVPPKPVGPAISSSRLPAAYTQPPAQPAKQMADEDEPGAFLKEKNVDWSHWVGNFADRWYYVLRQLEDGINAEFLTERPALIRFTCYSNGQIGNVSLHQSSGNLIYDHLQMLALMQTVPLPAFPSGTMRTSITLVEGWESHVQRPGEHTYKPGSFGQNFPMEKVRQWMIGR